MFNRISLMLGQVMTARLADLKREDGQGATEYAMVIGFIIVALGVTLALLGTSITNFLGRVAGDIDGLLP
jgi:Flp pilus assembly pilin Flp